LIGGVVLAAGSQQHPIDGDASHGPTVASMIWELEERLMHVCAGRPCEQPYSTVRL